MSFSDKQIELLQNLYNDASLGLTTGQKLYNYLKSNGETGYTLSKIKEFLKSLEVNQVFSRSCRAGAGLRLTQRSFYIIISLPALPGNRIRGPVQARAAPAKVTVPRPSPSGMLRGHWCTVRRPGADVGEASPVTSKIT